MGKTVFALLLITLNTATLYSPMIITNEIKQQKQAAYYENLAQVQDLLKEQCKKIKINKDIFIEQKLSDNDINRFKCYRTIDEKSDQYTKENYIGLLNYVITDPAYLNRITEGNYMYSRIKTHDEVVHRLLFSDGEISITDDIKNENPKEKSKKDKVPVYGKLKKQNQSIID